FSLPYHESQPESAFGMGLSFIPRALGARLLTVLTGKLHAVHPALAERLRDAEGKTFLVTVSDLPLQVLLTIRDGRMACEVLAQQHRMACDVAIRAASHTLLALLEGSEDGDALFFSRQLEVEGDTEALLVLRNALDNEQIEVRRIVYALFGPLAPAAERALNPLERLAGKFIRGAARWKRLALLPLTRRQDGLENMIGQLERRLSDIEDTLARKAVKGSKHG
ncbi:MAG: SCP2 sterol-binding domain-containing protein, partial [Alphaproteobacteria bacterium]|nr:SCP2 sterol-binding domain-containing protein [Alphaproteobacteria bacterium]